MAPFNKRQVGYIQAIAGRQQHTTLICGRDDGMISNKDDVTTVPAINKPKALDESKIYGGGFGSSGKDADAKSLLMYTWHLDKPELGWDSRTKHNNDRLEVEDFTNLRAVSTGNGNFESLNCFDTPVRGYVNAAQAETNNAEYVRNPEWIDSTHRATPDGFLNSTDIKFRFTLPQAVDNASGVSPMGQNHYEFRWIVFRTKKPTLHSDATANGYHSNLEQIRDGVSFRNYAYDLFMGQTGRKKGLLGYTFNPKLDQATAINGSGEGSGAATTPSELYAGYFTEDGTSLINTSSKVASGAIAPTGETEGMTLDDLLTCRLNRDDYVVMKDVRFFLGKEHGKSHFEDHLHWDWNDPIDTPHDNVLSSPTLNNKNYRWKMMLIGTSGGGNEVVLNHSVRWTTKMESG